MSVPLSNQLYLLIFLSLALHVLNVSYCIFRHPFRAGVVSAGILFLGYTGYIFLNLAP
jgi:hypothetical protein